MNNEQLKKILKGALIAVGSSALAYASTVVIPQLQASQSIWLITLTPIFSALINAANQWLKSQEPK